MLFHVLLADLEEVMGIVRWGGVKLEGEKIYSLVYADDVVLLAEDEAEMKNIMERLEKYLESRGLELNVGKAKVLRFWKGGKKKL